MIIYASRFNCSGQDETVTFCCGQVFCWTWLIIPVTLCLAILSLVSDHSQTHKSDHLSLKYMVNFVARMSDQNCWQDCLDLYCLILSGSNFFGLAVPSTICLTSGYLENALGSTMTSGGAPLPFLLPHTDSGLIPSHCSFIMNASSLETARHWSCQEFPRSYAQLPSDVPVSILEITWFAKSYYAMICNVNCHRMSCVVAV